jgi:eukaryotic-like serine/threonine-protein kinase
MIPTTCDSLVNHLREHQLLGQEQLDALATGACECSTDPRELARHLLRRGWLTAFQANQLLLGRGDSLRFGKYHLLERIGEGGMGKVYKARQIGLNRLVALKVLPGGGAAKTYLTERFRREIFALSQLNHPNIVQAIDADEVDGTLFFVMEYVDGIDLSRLVRQQGALPIKNACEYIRQAALGLQHVHERGLVHRDIKPSNLLLTNARGSRPGNLLKILDLGLARLRFGQTDENAAELTHAGVVIGTPDFLAPEQAVNAHTADIRADLYSLGCTLHFLLTGQAPFPGGSPLEKLFHHRLQAPLPPDRIRPGIPRWLVEVVNRLLAKRPAHRYQTPAELVAALNAGVGGETSTSTAVPRPVDRETPTVRDAETVPNEANPFAFVVGLMPTTEQVLAIRPRRVQRTLWSVLSGKVSRLLARFTNRLLAGKRRFWRS